MKTLVLFAATLLVLRCAVAMDETATPTERTSAPPEARFELVKAWTFVPATLRLDKKTGDTWLLSGGLLGPLNKLGWVKIPRQKHPLDKDVAEKAVNYQVLANEKSATLLLNVHTGAAWRLVHDMRQNALTWECVPEEGRAEVP